MCKTKHFFDHTGLFHKGLNRALTEHELDETLIPDDWHKAFTNEIHLFTGKWLVKFRIRKEYAYRRNKIKSN